MSKKHKKKPAQGAALPTKTKKKQKGVPKIKKRLIPIAPQRFKSIVIPILLIIVGINLFVLGGIYVLYKKTTLSFAVAPVVTVEAHLRQDLPTRIGIPSAKIDVAIQEAAIENGVWQTSQENATHLNTSMRPGEGGNIVIYGHNLKNIFGSLRTVKIGYKMNIKSNDGKTYEYTVQEIEIISPKHIEKVLPTDYEVLTVYTCVGFLDSQRLLIRAYPSKVSSL
jgi:LPXTG-site transpeptidase (sortase) family protein